MYRTSDGQLLPGFKGISGHFVSMRFNRDGTMLLGVQYESFDKPKILQWNAVSGESVPIKASDVPVGFNEFLQFTSFGDYYITGLPEDGRKLVVQSVNGERPERFQISFADNGTSSLAIALIKRAREVHLQGDVLRLTLNSGVTLSIKNSPVGGQIVDDRSQSQLRFPLSVELTASLDFREKFLSAGTIEDISDDGTFVAVRTMEHGLRIWETRTGQPLPNVLWHEAEPKVVKFVDQGQLLTIDETGQKRLWYIGQLKRETPDWMAGLGEALSGIRVVAQTELQLIPQTEYAPLRQRYIEKLQRAAAANDSDARAILANLRP